MSLLCQTSRRPAGGGGLWGQRRVQHPGPQGPAAAWLRAPARGPLAGWVSSCPGFCPAPARGARPTYGTPGRRRAAATTAASSFRDAPAFQGVRARDLAAEDFELIIVGSGNGACAFLARYLQATGGPNGSQPQAGAGAGGRRVLVLEEGTPFLSTSAIAHQANWTRSYAEAGIFKLHATFTQGGPGGSQRRPIISGRAVTQGGGGSINYSMLHESSEWLARELGVAGTQTGEPSYWDGLKAELGGALARGALDERLFQRDDPVRSRTPVAQAVHAALVGSQGGGGSHGGDFFEDVPACPSTGWIPQYIEAPPAAQGALGRVYTFNTQFDDAGQRTHSGYSLVAAGRGWESNPRVELWTGARVEALQFGGGGGGQDGAQPAHAPCTGLTVRRLGFPERVDQLSFDPARTTVVLAAGSSTPRLLLPHREALRNPAIGTRANDHILVPTGFYGLRQAADGSPAVSLKDQYLPLFADQVVTVEVPGGGGGDASAAATAAEKDGGGARQAVVVWYDFFAGPVSLLSYYLAHLFVSIWMPNWLKKACIGRPWLFQQLKTVTVLIISGVEWLLNCKYGLLSGGRSVPPLNVVTGILKFNIAYDGYYEPQPEQQGDAATGIVLHPFAAGPDGAPARDAVATPDGQVARRVLPPLMRKLDAVGARPWFLVQWLLKAVTGMPYNAESQGDIDAYIRAYAKSHLLTEQHLSGGCVLGHAAEDGRSGPGTVGTVKGTTNVVVADLSACSLPRVSPQMTAYMVGWHVATQRFGGQQQAAAAAPQEAAAASAGAMAPTPTAAVAPPEKSAILQQEAAEAEAPRTPRARADRARKQ